MTTRKQISQIILIFLAVNTIIGVWVWGVRQVLPINLPGSQEELYKGIAMETNPWLEPWQRWDAPHYQAIAERGYTAFDTALFTPPLYPLLMRLFGPLLGGNTLASGMLISSAAFLGCLIAFYFLARLELPNEKDAFRTVVYLAFFPTGFFLFAPYSESVFLLMVLMSFYATRKSRWVQAGLFGGLAALTRIPGSLIIIPLAWAAWSAWKTGDKGGWLAPILAGVGSIIYPLYVWIELRLPPTSILDALNQRGGHITFIGRNLIEAASRILHGQLVQENMIELAFSLLFIGLTISIWKRLHHIYGIYSITIMILFLTRLGSPQPLSGMARYVLEVFPAFLILAIWGRKNWANRIIMYLSWFGLLFFSAQYAIWGWVG